MTVAFITLAVFAGYYLWQRSRYEQEGPREAHGRALADTAAIATIALCIIAAGYLSERAGWNADAVRLIGAVIGAVLSGPARRTVLIRQRIDPRGVR